jgi:hypothetical protein
MDMIEVESTNLKTYGYDPEAKLLRLQFLKNSNIMYEYANVPQDIVDGLAKAESKGSYVARYIVRKFEHRRVEG